MTLNSLRTSAVTPLSKLVPLAVATLMLGACGDNSSDADAPERFVDVVCDDPLPAQAQQHSFTSPVPQDLDPLTDPLPTTEIYLTVMLPERCPGEQFPLVLQSHGYGGSRRTALAADGSLYPQHAGLTAIDELTTALPHHNYVVISWDQRGHGESQPRNAGGYARLNAPDVETVDARALLDWAYDHADLLQLWPQDGSGVAKDLHVGTLGYSYGGAAQLPLAALDRRIDTLVPVATWYKLQHSLAAEEALKQSWTQLLCLFAVTPSDGAIIGTINTPAIDTLCNNVAIRQPLAFNTRTYDELIERIGRASALPRPVSEEEFTGLFDRGMGYFRRLQSAGLPWNFGEPAAQLPPVPALFLQGNRDGLFNLTEGYLNWRYFRAAGGDARLLSMETGHLTPFAAQVDGTANCGGLQGVQVILAWFDYHLKGLRSAAYDALPRLCISVQASPGAPAGPEVGVELEQMPIGSLDGSGALPVRAQRLEIDIRFSDGRPSFVPLMEITEADYVLAGIPTIGRITVTPGAGAAHDAIALVGVGLRRGGQLHLIDDQILGVREGVRSTNRFIDEGDPLMLPAIGEVLQQGDELGLLFYEQQVQYSVVLSLTSIGSAVPGGLVSYIAGKPFPHPLADALTPLANLLTNPNPYHAVLEDVQLPVFQPGVYGGSRWSRPAQSAAGN